LSRLATPEPGKAGLARVSSRRVGVRLLRVPGRVGGAGEEVAADVGDEVSGAGGSVVEVDGSVGGDGGDDEVGNGLAGGVIEVGGGGLAAVCPRQ